MIYRIDNVFDNEKRKDILERSKKYLRDHQAFVDSGEMHPDLYLPGKQTSPNLHKKIPFANDILKVIKNNLDLDFVVINSWVNWTNGSKKDLNWHNHKTFDYAGVYYLKIPLPFFNNGTLISEDNSKTRDRKRDRKDKFYKASQTSLLLFPGRMNHTAPLSPFRLDRYTFAIDLMKR